MGPQGGPKDITPPQMIKAKPANGALNSKAKELEIEFNEFVSLDKPQDKIIVSPPQIIPPTIRAAGKKVLVTLNDSLLPNTTYSIDFTNSIVDITEHNALAGFNYSFSTGNEIDSLQIAGLVLDAENLNPLSNLIVGIYDNLNDTAFIKTKPLRIARTDEEGKFCIKNVKQGRYHIFALNDLNHDYIYNDPGEQLAFLDSIIVPSAESVIVSDTIKAPKTVPTKTIANKTKLKEPLPIVKDSVRQIRKTIFHPNNILLSAFKQKTYKQYFIKAERKDKYKLSFFFNAPNIKIPIIKPLNFTESVKGFIQKSEKADTISYWIADSSVWKMDTLKVSLQYNKTDSAGNLITKIDTLALGNKKENLKKKPSKVPDANQFLKVNSNVEGLFDIFKPIIFTFDTPILSADEKKIHLFSKKDSIWKEVPIKLQKLDSLDLKFGINYTWDSELEYKLNIDSAAFYSKYGKHSNKSSMTFKLRALDQYATLIVTLVNYNPNAIIEILDSKDEVVKRLPANQQGTKFEYLTPGDYYLRLFIDTNNNGIWDAGKYADKRQPEQVYYFNQKIGLRANWDVEEEWDLNSIPLSKQKPKELIKKAK